VCTLFATVAAGDDFGTIKAPSPSPSKSLVALGRKLFWDPRISAHGKTSCASCHTVDAWGSDRRGVSLGDGDKPTKRNSQTVLNATLQPALRWIGDRKSAADQAAGSLTGSMGHPTADAAVARLHELGYEAEFARVFSTNESPLSIATFGQAVEAYEQTLVTPAAFDRFIEGDTAALSAKQLQGLKLFVDIGCADCHSGALLGGESIEKFGVVKPYWKATASATPDEGLYLATDQHADKYRFRVSMLRNIAKTAPYFHDGSVAELDRAVAVMAEVQLDKQLGETERDAIVAFLESLTGDVPQHYGPPDEGE
jgi:cytochrome c peroxidase